MTDQIKMVKLVDDKCFGVSHEQIDQCELCWVKNSCAVMFRNSQPKKKPVKKQS